jgi:hypothetical protein
LNEAELHIFNKIRGELDPVKLEVCEHVLATRNTLVHTELGALAWPIPMATTPGDG